MLLLASGSASTELTSVSFLLLPNRGFTVPDSALEDRVIIVVLAPHPNAQIRALPTRNHQRFEHPQMRQPHHQLRQHQSLVGSDRCPWLGEPQIHLRGLP